MRFKIFLTRRAFQLWSIIMGAIQLLPESTPAIEEESCALIYSDALCHAFKNKILSDDEEEEVLFN